MFTGIRHAMLRVFTLLAAFLLASPAFAQDAADAVVRLNRLENQMRTLSGQIEQLQFENRQLREQLRKFQEDVEFRFQESRPGARPQAAPQATPQQGGASPARPAPAPQGQPQRRGDAFDPSQTPEAPGAPRPLGTTPPPSAPLASAPPAATPPAGAPLTLPGGQLAGIGDLIEQDEPAPGAAPADLNGAARPGAPAPAVPRTGPSVAATGSPDPRTDYEAAYASFQQRQYEQAEMGFRRFIQSHPRDRLVPEATFWLGESYLQRNRYREAAEQFLNVSADYPDAPRAPEALLKLGVSLNALGARDRACAVFAEVDRKYPQAAPAIRQANEREQKRARCV